MTSTFSRRSFSTAVCAWPGLAALGLAPRAGAFPGWPNAEADEAWPGFPFQPDELVRAVVGASHRDLERVKSLVEAHPALANAAWDWGFGDWETALGAAAHTGRREIAEYLLARGARLDLFAAAMLGQLDAVRGMVAALPGVQRVHGPHGIPLLAHAEAGGEAAAAVADFLRGLGDAGIRAEEAPLAEEESALYPGEYAYGPGATDRFAIGLERGHLTFQKQEEPKRFLLHLGRQRFHPAGVPTVILEFAVESGRCTGVVVSDHDLRLTAARQPGPIPARGGT